MADDQVDLASGLLWGAGVTAVAEHPLDDGLVLLRSDVPSGGLDSVSVALAPVEGASIRLVDITDDGVDAWRDHAQVVTAGRRLVVRPPWLGLDLAEIPDRGPDPLVIELDPGRAWGHGAHPTTRLCLAELERLLTGTTGRIDAAHPGLGVIDVGCGSGALSVAAAMLGAAWVQACDLDPAAVAATVSNAERNGVADRVQAHLVPSDSAADPLAVIGGADDERPADLIVANIGAAALVALAPHFRARITPGGTLVLSGLLDPPPPEVAKAYAPLVATVTTLDGWAALTLSAS